MTMGAPAARFCWVDLAATDASRAAEFYEGLFGWSAHPTAANGGTFVRLAGDGDNVASLYQIHPQARDTGVPSHWTPYVHVEDAQSACDRAVALGGTVAVAPFEVEGVARIALVVDCVGASFGLWEDLCR